MKTTNLKLTLACLSFALLGVLCSTTSAAETAQIIEADVCIYGGTSGGVAAAVQTARMGKRAVIAEPGRHLGGMTAGGLSAVDIGDPRTVGGIAREYFSRLVASYGKTLDWNKPFVSKGGGPATGGAYSIEPHVAERVFNEMAREAKVVVHFNARLASVKKDGARITEFTAEDGTVFRAKMFIDATYEGDLMAKAGVSYTLVREGNAKYGETYNGISYDAKYQPRTKHLQPGPTGRLSGGQGVWDRDFPLDPYVAPGDPKSGLLPLINEGEPGRPGEPAPGVQAYCFRLCLTTAADRIPIAPPPDYDPKRYEIVARYIAACLANGDDMDLRWFSKHDALPNDKWDFNTATFGGNLPGASWEWPEATYARREQIAKEHENYHRGLLHFLATDPRVPEKVRDDMKRFGLPRDEFTDNGGWPHQLYIREARRMVSDLVMTEHHTFGKEVAPNSVGLGTYGTDTHEIRRIVKDGVVIREGTTAGGRDGAPPYPIGYAAIVPKAGECENLFVTFALSASHTAFSSIRMEPVFMVTSQSAATAACIAIDQKVPVQKVDSSLNVDSTTFHYRLLKDGQVLAWNYPKKSAGAGVKSGVSGGGGFEVRVPAPGPGAIADTVIQDAIDAVSEAGGGVVLLGAGDFKLSRGAGDETVVLRSGVTLRGQGYVTHIYLDPTTPPDGKRYYPVRIGTETTPASNVTVEHLRYTGNNAKIGGGSIMGFNARLGSPSARLLSSDNVTIRHCWIYDAMQAAGHIKDDPWAYPTPERFATQSRNWQVYNNFMDTCGNKMVEFAEVNGGVIADNYITNAYEGPQVIFGSRNVQIRGNEVYYTDTGINISEGSNHIRVSGNHTEPMPTINKGTVGVGLIFRTEPAPFNSVISDVVVTGNIFRNQTTQAKCTVRFQTRKEALACSYEAITFTGNVFDGDVQFLDKTTPAKTTIKDIIFADNICEGDVASVPNATMASSHVMVRNNILRKAEPYTLNASQWIWSGNTHSNGTLQVAAGATANVVNDNVTASPISDSGAATALTNNIVFPNLPRAANEAPPAKPKLSASSAKAIRPTFADVAYGAHERQRIDFWKANTSKPAPLYVHIHGGGWLKGDRKDLSAATIEYWLSHGVSVASIDYRYSSDAPLPAPVLDAARAIQFLRSKAAEWNIDKSHVVCEGASAGACTSLWLAFHDDLADPTSNDPIARESTRICGAVAGNAQTSIDPPVIREWLGEAVLKHPMIATAVGARDKADALARYEDFRQLFQEFSPINHVSAGDPPVLLYYRLDDQLPARDEGHGIHHPVFGIKLKQQCDQAGVRCELHLNDDGTGPLGNEFLLSLLKPQLPTP